MDPTELLTILDDEHLFMLGVVLVLPPFIGEEKYSVNDIVVSLSGFFSGAAKNKELEGLKALNVKIEEYNKLLIEQNEECATIIEVMADHQKTSGAQSEQSLKMLQKFENLTKSSNQWSDQSAKQKVQSQEKSKISQHSSIKTMQEIFHELKDGLNNYPVLPDGSPTLANIDEVIKKRSEHHHRIVTCAKVYLGVTDQIIQAQAIELKNQKDISKNEKLPAYTV